MKAKEYANMFHEAVNAGQSPEKVILEVLRKFLEETEALQELRKATTDSAFAATYREQSEKWRAFARLVPGIKEDGFYAAVMDALKAHPDLIALLQKSGFTR